jgi:purine-binding chemotaxis protein CheW
MSLNNLSQTESLQKTPSDRLEFQYYFIFRVGQGHYALQLSNIERVLRIVAVTVLPEAPFWVDGVINYAGRVMPVVDLRQRFSEPSKAIDLDDRLLILGEIALRIESESDVAQVPRDQVNMLPMDLKGSRPISAVIHHLGCLYLELDSDRLMDFPGDPDLDWGLLEFMNKLETLYLQHQDGKITSDEMDDFTRIEGIGKVYADRLQEGGLHTFQALAKANVDQIKLLSKPTRRSAASINDWIIQAQKLSKTTES